ncbi:MAG: hypothetical protein JRH15_11540 [Deltaproteobacteria bacterium]|nr:hypothetical protein [Deltaproteobacteria bacterium]
MPEIIYNKFDDHLADLQPGAKQGASVYLIHGEELLCKKALEALLDKLLPKAKRTLSYEPIDGAGDNIHEAVHSANTYSFLAGPKVVAITDSRLFYGRQDKSKLLQKAKDAVDRDDISKAGRYLLSLMGQAGLALEDLKDEAGIKTHLIEGGSFGDVGWLQTVVSHCMENNLVPPDGSASEKFLQAAIEKGFPKSHYLVFTTDLVDKRRSLYKTIKSKGIIVNCSVPKGDRRADRQVQEAVLRERMQVLLTKGRKRMNEPAFRALYDLTGFDLRTFSNNLEKLILYVADRPAITVEDVQTALSRSKQDPIYELTNAISDKHLDSALFLLDSSLSAQMHPLQIFAAIVNHLRRLYLAKSFTESEQGRGFRADLPFQNFKTQVLPAIQAYDQDMRDRYDALTKTLEPEPEPETPSKAKKKKTKKGAKQKKAAANDLVLAPNPANAYPVYLLMKKTNRFTMTQLTDIYQYLAAADMRFKRTGQNPKIILEEIILRVCC